MLCYDEKLETVFNVRIEVVYYHTAYTRPLSLLMVDFSSHSVMSELYGSWAFSTFILLLKRFC